MLKDSIWKKHLHVVTALSLKMLDQEKLDNEIIRMKKLICRLVRNKDKDYIGTIEKYNQRVILAVADFKCQNPKCFSEKELTIHHLIMRPAKKYMDFWRYASQRYYWANQIILCNKCHRKYHLEMGKDIGEDKLTISDKRIEEIKKHFCFAPKNL